MGHEAILIDLVKEKKPARMMEVGVHVSSLTKAILRNADCFNIIKEYWACDPFLKWAGMRGTQAQWDGFYLHASRLAIWFPQHHVIRTLSVLCASLFPDGYFDFVYIDADHSYEAVKQDINIWLPKIRPGGIIGGHDYYHDPAQALHPGVHKAVNELFPGCFQVLNEIVWVHHVAN